MCCISFDQVVHAIIELIWGMLLLCQNAWHIMFCVVLNLTMSFLLIFVPSVQSESGCANIVSAAPCLAEPQQYEVQFGRLRSFLTGR